MNDDLELTLKLNLEQAHQQIAQLKQQLQQALSVKGGQVFSADLQQATQLQAVISQLQTQISSLGNNNGLDKQIASAVRDVEKLNSQMQSVANNASKVSLGSLGKQAESSLRTATSSLPGASGAFSAVDAGMAGGAAAAGLSALGSAANALISKFSELGDSASRAAQSVSGSARFDSVKSADWAKDYAKSAAANSAGAQDAAKLKDQLEGRFYGGLQKVGDWLHRAGLTEAEKHKEDLDSAKQARDGLKLGGEAKIGFDRLLQSRVDMEEEIASHRQELETQIANKRRDLALQQKELDTQNSQARAKIELSQKQENENYSLQAQKLQADVGFKASEKKYAIDQQADRRNFANRQQFERDDLNRKQAQEKQTQANKVADEKTSFKNSQGDKAADFARQSGYRAQDAAQKQQEIGLKGGDALDFLLAGQEAQKEQARAVAEFATQSARENRDEGLKESQESRDFGLRQKFEGDDLKARQGQEGITERDKLADEAAKHSIDVQTHMTELRQQENELTLRHNQAMESASMELKNLAQNSRLAQERLNNEKSDSQKQAIMDSRRFERDTDKQQRSQDYAEGDYAEQLAHNPDLASLFTDFANAPGQGALVDWFNKGQMQRGENWGLDQNKLNEGKTAASKAYDQLAAEKPRTPYDPNIHQQDHSQEWGTINQQNDDRANQKAISNGSPMGVPSRGNADVAAGKAMGLSGTKLRDYLEGRGYDVSNVSDEKLDSFAVGGFIDRDKIAQLHAGEYVVNPQRKDNLDLLMAAGQKMADNGHFDFSADTVGWRKGQQSIISQIMSGGGQGAGMGDSGGGSSIFGMSAAQMRQMAAQAQNSVNVSPIFNFDNDFKGIGSGELQQHLTNHFQQNLMPAIRQMVQESIISAISHDNQRRFNNGVR